MTRQVGHVIDFLPTFAELAGADYPSHHNGHEILPVEGKSLVPVFYGEERNAHDALFWELDECRAVRKGKWKAVSHGAERLHAGFDIPAGLDSWELYDMDSDRCELHDLSARYPDTVQELDVLWQNWYRRCTAGR